MCAFFLGDDMGVLEIIQVMNEMIERTKYISRKRKIIGVEKTIEIIDKNKY